MSKIYTVKNNALADLIGLRFDAGQEISCNLYMEAGDIEKLANMYEINPYLLICPCTTMHNCNKHALEVFAKSPSMGETGSNLTKIEKIEMFADKLERRGEVGWYIDGLISECAEEGRI